jgi:hypothetical protein
MRPLLSFVLLLGMAPAAMAAPPPPAAGRASGHDSPQPPRLWIMQNLCGLIAVPAKETEWPLEEKLAPVKAVGFDGVDTHFMGSDPAAPARVRELIDLARKHGLRMGAPHLGGQDRGSGGHSAFERTAILDGRVSKRRAGSGVWKRVMVHWLREAQPGASFPSGWSWALPAMRSSTARAARSPTAGNRPARCDPAERTWNEAARETGVGHLHGGAPGTGR